jgi:general secretion pathway protein E
MKRIPFAFARSHGVLARLDDAGGLMLRLRQGASPEVLAEMRRHTGLPMRAELLSAEDFEAALAAEYAEAEGGSLLSDGLGDSAELTSLMQDSQRIQDLLESDDDAPIIRLINTIFMQALARRRLGYPYRAFRGTLGGALPSRWRPQGCL